MEFKTFEYAQKNGDGVIIFSEQTEEDAEEKLKQIVRFPLDWRLQHIKED